MENRKKSVMDKMIPEEVDDLSLQKILNSLLDAEKNLELKTHIYNPKDLAGLYIWSEYLDVELPTQKNDEGKTFSLSGDAIKSYITIYLKYMISKDRLSRGEIIKAVSSMFDKETIRMSISEKMTSNLK